MLEPSMDPRESFLEEHPGPETAREVERGALFIPRLAAVLRTALTHGVANQAFRRQAEEVLALLRPESADPGDTTLAIASGYFFFNEVRVTPSAGLLPVHRVLMAELELRGVAGLRLAPGLTFAQLQRFIDLFVEAASPQAAVMLSERLREAGLDGVELIDSAGLAGGAGTPRTGGSPLISSRKQTEREAARHSYRQAVHGVRGLLLQTRQTGIPDLRQGQRVVLPLVDLIMRHRYSIVGLTAIKEHDSYTCAHSVNVCLLSLGIGACLGLRRRELADLGVAALLHDLGKIAVPGDILRKPGSLTPGEWDLMSRHPLEGARMLARVPSLSGLVLDTMRVCLEHHLNYDRTGYPQSARETGQSAATRIVAAADCFDALTAHRSYRKRPWTPFEALQHVCGLSGTRFDPAVTWALIRTVGRYPAGTLLLTGSGCVALAVAPNPADPERPDCLLLRRPGTAPAPPQQPLEYWDPMPAEEGVARVLPPEECEQDLGLLLAA